MSSNCGAWAGFGVYDVGPPCLVCGWCWWRKRLRSSVSRTRTSLSISRLDLLLHRLHLVGGYSLDLGCEGAFVKDTFARVLLVTVLLLELHALIYIHLCDALIK